MIHLAIRSSQGDGLPWPVWSGSSPQRDREPMPLSPTLGSKSIVS